MTTALSLLAIIGAVGSIFAVIVAVASRRKKSTGDVPLLGAGGFVNTKLDPEGTVMIRGELWRARSRDGTVVAQTNHVAVVGVQGHLLLVEPVSDKL